MQFKQLEKTTYRDDVIAEAMYQREVEYYHYDLDRKNFLHIAETLPGGDYKIDMLKRVADIEVQMQRVDDIYNALQAQITDPAAHEAAVVRAREKRAAL